MPTLLCVIVATLILKRQLTGSLSKTTLSLTIFISVTLLGIHYHIDLVTGSGINESVVYFLNSEGEGAAVNGFYPIIGSFVVFSIAVIGLTLILLKLLTSHQIAPRHQRYRIAIATIFILFGFFKNPGLIDIVNLNRSYSEISTKDLYTPKHFLDPKKIIWPEMNKNLVYIYLESVEKTYLDEEIFPGLMPNLQKLKQQGLFFEDIKQVYGTGWTIGGMTGTQCGIPLLTTSGANSMSGVDQFLPQATCIGDVLKKQGYHLNYLGGADIDFAGKGSFYKTHGFERVEGLKQLRNVVNEPAYESPWGLYDDTLFNLAKNRFDELDQKENPFGLFMLTLDTHSPNGHTPRSCQSKEYMDGSNPILNSVHCADKLVYDFIQDIRNHPSYKNTTIVVSSDHLAMPNSARKILETRTRRNLFLILDEDIPPQLNNKIGSSLDIAPTILSQLTNDKNSSTNTIQGLAFGRNLLHEGLSLSEDIDNFDNTLRASSKFLSTLWNFPQLNEGLTIKNTENKIYLGNRSLKIPTLIRVSADQLKVTEVLFPFFSKLNLQDQISKQNPNQKFLWIDQCYKVNALVDIFPDTESSNCLVAGSMNGRKLFVANIENEEKIPFQRIKDYIESGSSHPNIIYANKKNKRISRFKQFDTSEVFSMYFGKEITNHAVIRSAGFRTGHSYISQKDTEIDLSKKASRGLTLYSFTKNLEIKKEAHIDSCDINKFNNPSKISDFQTEIRNIKQNKKQLNFAIVAHDSAICGGYNLSKLFSGLALTRWQEISFRKPYIGIIDKYGKVYEWVGKANTAIAIELMSDDKQRYTAIRKN